MELDNALGARAWLRYKRSKAAMGFLNKLLSASAANIEGLCFAGLFLIK